MQYSELNEKKIFGTSDFPIECRVMKDPDFTMMPHWHKEFEILRVESGVLHLSIDQRSYKMEAGDIAFIESGSLHSGMLESCIFSYAVFDLSMLCRRKSDAVYRFIEPIMCRKISFSEFFEKGKNVDIELIVDRLFSVFNSENEFTVLDFYAEAFNLIRALYSGGYIKKIKNTRYEHQLAKIADIIDFIEEHYRDPLTLSTLSKKAGMNEKYFCRFFKEFTNITPIDYINRLRIENAAHSLLEAGFTVTEAALDNGFNDISYFSKIFKKYKGVSPKRYSKINI